MLSNKLRDRILQNGKTFQQYLETTHVKFSGESASADFKDELRRLNYHRMSRIAKTYKIDEELKSIVEKNITEPQIWMTLTEDWCGDSAQIIPYIAAIASQNSLIDFRILERDSNPDIMDLYLSNGQSRSIPKLIVFDNNWNELFQWGARPKPGQEYFLKLKEEGLPKDSINEKMQLWYNADKGKSLEAEFKELLTSPITIELS